MKKTALYEQHKKLNAKILPFSGYVMPITYPEGINYECSQIRNNVGIFDVSHMGQFRISGLKAEKFLQNILINNISKINVGDAQYTALCNEQGGIIDDLILYKENNSFLLIVNASNIEKNYNWIKSHIDEDVIFENESDQYSLIAIQGPKSRDVIEKIFNIEVKNKFYSFINCNYNNENLVISRTGYTGELGYELMGSNKAIVEIWEKCIDLNVVPCGLASRDILRIEMKYCLYGNDMNESITPYESNLGWITSLDKGDFIGKSSIIEKKNTRKLVGFKMLERGIPRKDYKILIDGEIVGEVTSGTQSPTINTGIGLGRILYKNIKHGQEIEILIRNKKVKAQLYLEPFLDKTSLFS